VAAIHFDFSHGKIFYSPAGRSLLRIRWFQIPLVQQVVGDFREEAQRLLHGFAAGFYNPGRNNLC
jgi:hypothetical protein